MEALLSQMTTLLQTLQQTDLKAASSVQTYTKAEVANHADLSSCWMIVYDKVYDITPFVHSHPGGYDVLLEHAGRDATLAFEDKGHSLDAKRMLHDYYIGDLQMESKR